MTMDVDNASSTMPREELVELLEQLRFIKRRSIAFLEAWSAATAEPELRAGFSAQVTAERSILDRLTERLREMGVTPDDAYEDEHIVQIFRELEAERRDVVRMGGFHRALKEYLIARFNMLRALADPDTRDLMEDLVDEEAALQRWGESRRLSSAVPAELTTAVGMLASRVAMLTAQSRERQAREIRERAEQVTGGVLPKRMADLQAQLQAMMQAGGQQPGQRGMA